MLHLQIVAQAPSYPVAAQAAGSARAVPRVQITHALLRGARRLGEVKTQLTLAPQGPTFVTKLSVWPLYSPVSSQQPSVGNSTITSIAQPPKSA